MKITADTNVLVRAIVEDNPQQSKTAQAELAGAEAIALALPALCELVWVLLRGYKIPPVQIADTIRRLIDGGNVMVNRRAVEAGLAVLVAGGDFVDGVIAHEGRCLGGTVFVSFDRKATTLLEAGGEAARLLL